MVTVVSLILRIFITRIKFDFAVVFFMKIIFALFFVIWKVI